MSTKMNVSLSLAAGLFGGMLSRYVAPMPVQAQAIAPKTIKAQSFTLVNENGAYAGGWGVAHDGKIFLNLVDHEHGRTLFIDPIMALEKTSRPNPK